MSETSRQGGTLPIRQLADGKIGFNFESRACSGANIRYIRKIGYEGSLAVLWGVVKWIQGETGFYWYVWRMTMTDVKDIYVSLDEARGELARRWQDAGL